MKQNISHIPKDPGVYRFFDSSGTIIYIGKAKNLRARVRSYFVKDPGLEPAKQEMIPEIANLDYIIVSNEKEALLLEAGLIKKHQPKYNIVLRDDKNWSYIVVTKEPLPRILVTRGTRQLKGEYFGPFTNSTTARTVVQLLHRIFPLYGEGREPSKLQRDLRGLQQFLKPSTQRVIEESSEDRYTRIVAEARTILRGSTKDLLARMREEMNASAANQFYERARVFRDKIAALEKLSETQSVIHPILENQDIVAVAQEGKQALVTVMQLRGGRMYDALHYPLHNALELPASEVLEKFLLQYYSQLYNKPRELLIEGEVSAAAEKALIPLRIKYPARGVKNKLLKLAQKNAWVALERSANMHPTPYTLYILKKLLSLHRVPVRIEAYDISNIQGQYAVGGMVVAHNGELAKSEYRKFKIRTVRGANDVAMMREVLIRRQRHPEWPDPDLILLDGGRAQLSTVYSILKPEWRDRVAAIAKREEALYLPDQARPIRLSKADPALQLLIKIRDEVHRFAITYYRKRHRKSVTNNK